MRGSIDPKLGETSDQKGTSRAETDWLRQNGCQAFKLVEDMGDAPSAERRRQPEKLIARRCAGCNVASKLVTRPERSI